MIPKVIHYCWFGQTRLPELAQKCVQSWRKFCPDYQIIEWNECNYDIHKSKFMERAYERKKWAFVSDYARLDIVYQHGGIYLDTDVELLKPLDDLLDHEMYAGFENSASGELVAFGLGFGAISDHPYLKEMLDVYDAIYFPEDDRDLAKISCPIIQTNVLMRHGLVVNGYRQSLPRCEIFGTHVFSPKNFITGELIATSETYSIHHYNMSWFTENKAAVHRKEWEMNQKYKSKKFVKLVMFPQKIWMHFMDGGAKGVLKYFQILLKNRQHIKGE